MWHLFECILFTKQVEITGSKEIMSVRFEVVYHRSVHRLLVTANIPSSLILVTLLMEAPGSSETSVLTRGEAKVTILLIKNSLTMDLMAV
jgi:hypothetical protein